jgi:hypothetical protein
MLRSEGGVRLWLICIKLRQPQPHPQGDRKGPHSAPRHTRPYKEYEEGFAVPCLCKGGCSEDEGMGPLRSPWDGALPIGADFRNKGGGKSKTLLTGEKVEG